MSHIYCPECGFQNPEASNYCSRCGALLTLPSTKRAGNAARDAYGNGYGPCFK